MNKSNSPNESGQQKAGVSLAVGWAAVAAGGTEEGRLAQ